MTTKTHTIELGNRTIILSDAELSVIGNYWEHQCDLDDVETVLGDMQCDAGLPDEAYNDEEMREEIAKSYREQMNYSNYYQRFYERMYDLVAEYVEDWYDWKPGQDEEE